MPHRVERIEPRGATGGTDRRGERHDGEQHDDRDQRERVTRARLHEKRLKHAAETERRSEADRQPDRQLHQAIV